MTRVAFITGGTRGIGKAISARLRAAGYKVAAGYAGNEVAAQSCSDELGVFCVKGNVSSFADCAEAVKKVEAELGPIDTLVNNAGIFVAKPFTDYTQDDYAATIGVNLAGFFRITQLAIEQMLVHGGGHIVNVTTSLVDHANSQVPSALASLTKGGLQSATKSLAIEYATRGIRVNAVSPGIIKTPMHPEETHEFLAALHPVARMGESSDVAEAVVYLENAPFVTGEILHVDGGVSAGH